MSNTYQIYLISDSTGETLDRIFLALKAQFKNFDYKTHQYSFTRTQNQITKILDITKKNKNSIILYTVVDNKLAKFLAEEANKLKIPCFGVLGDLILSFSKLLNQEASHIPSGQHVLDEEYDKRIEAVQYTITHDDGKIISDLENSDVVLVGVSRTSKTPTSIYLANRGYKVANVPLIPEKDIPAKLLESSKKTCVVGLVCDVSRLSDVRRNRIHSLQENRPGDYTNEKKISDELEKSKKLFKKYNWPIIDVTRKSVEETAASIIKILDILNSK